MSVKKGDILDEHKRLPHSCGLVIKVMGGGDGFEKVVCCDHELTEQDVVADMGPPAGRKKGMLPPANRGTFDANNPDVAFSMGPMFTMADDGPIGVIKQHVLDRFRFEGTTMSWINKSINTPYHIAETNKWFRPVYQGVQRFITDVSALANEAAALAGEEILPRLQNWHDVSFNPLRFSNWKKLSELRKDLREVGRVIWAGTLAEIRPTDEQLLNGFEASTRDSHGNDIGKVKAPPLTKRQIELYWDVFSTPSESQSISNQEIDSLFSMDMPDWLSKPEPDIAGVTPQQAEIPARDDSLSPVELPSRVQAMRPVESVISETGPSIESQPTEKEGPLAGLRGVIPSAPIGSSRRPKAISLKLLATDKQQAGALLFAQIVAGESAPRVVTSLSTVTSQRTLRIAISVVFWVVLGAILFLRSQWMPISATLPPDVSGASNAIAAIPGDASVLVVVDYDPSLAGELEAVRAPVLNHLVLTRQPRLVFLSTSAHSAGLIERLASNAHIPAPYFNLGYLPRGSAGIAGFLVQPNRVISSAAAQSFAEYSAVIMLTDHAESGRAWVHQLDVAKQTDPSLARVSGVALRDGLGGGSLELRARLVLNAAGPWADELLARGGLRRAAAPLLRARNLVLRRPPSVPFAVGARSRDRFLFLVPWEGRTIVGTSYEPAEQPASDPLDFLEVASRAEPSLAGADRRVEAARPSRRPPPDPAMPDPDLLVVGRTHTLDPERPLAGASWRAGAGSPRWDRRTSAAGPPAAATAASTWGAAPPSPAQ